MVPSVVLGAYVGLLVNQHLGLDPFLGMFVAAVALFALGYVVQRFVINLVVNGPIFITLLLTFGLALLLTQGMNIAFTANYQGHPDQLRGDELRGGGVQIPLGRLLAFVLSVLVTVALVAVMNRTRVGMSIMATGMDRGAARLIDPGPRLRPDLRHRGRGLTPAWLDDRDGRTFNSAPRRVASPSSFVIAVPGGLGQCGGSSPAGCSPARSSAGRLLPPPGPGSHAPRLPSSLILVPMFQPSGLVGKAFYSAWLEV